MFNIDSSYIALIFTFASVSVCAWLIMELFTKGQPRAEKRLEKFSNPNVRREGSREKRDLVSRVLAKASPALAKPLRPKTEAEQSRLKLRLAHAGFRDEMSTTIFLGMKLAGLLVGFLVGGGVAAVTTGFNMQGLLRVVAIAGGCFFIPDIVLAFLSHGRRQQIFLGLPDALDLLVVCVEAGLGLDQAMRKVSEEMKKSHGVIAEEFGLCNMQLQMGRTRAEVLHELGLRSGVDDVRALASILIQADKFGSSIAQALRVQSDAMRTRRRQIAEEKAAKTAVKLIFPLVVFIFPGIFVVLVGPAAITLVRDMFPVMTGG
jgi:tight adherence protein C